MGTWKFWDWFAYGCILIAALVLAFDAAIKNAPSLSPHLADFSTSEYWSFLPLALLAISGAIFLIKAIRARIPPYIPTYLPQQSATQAAPPPPVAPAIDYGDPANLIERCWNNRVPGSNLARDIQALNVATAFKEDLKIQLRLEQFSRFTGSGTYVESQTITDRARFTSNAHIVSYGATVAIDVDQLRVLVDFAAETGDGRWFERRRLPLCEFRNKTRGEHILVRVIVEAEDERASRYNHPSSREARRAEGPRGELRWGEKPLDREQTKRFLRPVSCRARLVIKGDDRGEQYYYFMIVTPRGAGSTPIVIDESDLQFPDLWFAQDRRAAELARR